MCLPNMFICSTHCMHHFYDRFQLHAMDYGHTAFTAEHNCSQRTILGQIDVYDRILTVCKVKKSL